MYVCIYTHTHTHTHSYIHTYIHKYIHTHYTHTYRASLVLRTIYIFNEFHFTQRFTTTVRHGIIKVKKKRR